MTTFDTAEKDKQHIAAMRLKGYKNFDGYRFYNETTRRTVTWGESLKLN